MAKFLVKRIHIGDKPYQVGDTREANPSEVAHLVQNGVLKPIKSKAKNVANNKAMKAPNNK